MANQQITDLYRDVLFREPSVEEISYWSSRIDSGVPLTHLQALFLDSGEGRQVHEVLLPLTVLYQVTFGRAPDAAGLSYWSEKIASGEIDLSDAFLAFAASSEFRSAHPHIGTVPSPEHLVGLIYENLLGREPDAAGMAYWASLLHSGEITQAALLRSFGATPEFEDAAGAKLREFLGDFRKDGDLDQEYGSLLDPHQPVEPEVPDAPNGPTEPGGSGGDDGGEDGGSGGDEEPEVVRVARLTPSYDSDTFQGGAASFGPVMSADGTVVAFSSFDTNVVEGDTNSKVDPFIWDGTEGALSGIAIDGTLVGGAAGAISGDGQLLVFTSDSQLVGADTDSTDDVYAFDRQTELVTLVLNDDSAIDFSLSDDGRFLTFSSNRNYVAGDNLTTRDIFVLDRNSGTFELLSHQLEIGGETGGHSSSPVITGDGRFVAFTSGAGNLTAGDTNDLGDVFVYDRQGGTIKRVSVSSEGQQGNGHSSQVSISDDGRFVVFESDASNLVAGDLNGVSDVFLHDRDNNTTIRLSAGLDGETDGESVTPRISGDGRFVVFESAATNLVSDDVNGKRDLFLIDLQTSQTIRVAEGSTQYDEDNFMPVVSDDGRFIALQTEASLSPGDTDTSRDVYLLSGTDWWLA